MTDKTDAEKLIKLLKVENVDQVVKKLTNTIIDRVKQNLEGENEELLNRAIYKYRATVARRSWNNAQKWCKWSDEGPVLMPDNTRLYYRKGETEVVVQEFPPQMRLMKFVGSLRRPNTSEQIAPEESHKVYSYSLALPYLIFVYKFVDGMFREVYLSFCDRPLKRLTERPMKPYLCNVDSSLKLCLGNSFESGLLEKGNIYQQIALILNFFWASVYNEDWSSHFWEYRKHFESQDPRMKDLESWQDASGENPLFVIDDVKWKPHTTEQYGHMIVKLLENDSTNHKFEDELYMDLSENFVDEVKNVFEENVKNVESKVKSISTDDLARELFDVLKELV